MRQMSAWVMCEVFSLPKTLIVIFVLLVLVVLVLRSITPLLLLTIAVFSSPGVTLGDTFMDAFGIVTRAALAPHKSLSGAAIA
jgi:hypothetical protein